MTTPRSIRFNPKDRRTFIGDSDARIIMGDDEANLIRLWREKRGEVEPEDLSGGNLIVQLGRVTEDLNRRWYERNTGHVIKDMQRHQFCFGGSSQDCGRLSYGCDFDGIYGVNLS
jgi:predicted phage-related endonuclease